MNKAIPVDDRLVYVKLHSLISVKPDIRYEEEDIQIHIGQLYVAIPKWYVIKHRDMFERLSSTIGQLLQDHDIQERGA